jgi:4-amino-4-deoxy-L-arabinose transferase-like glycosyltransferase
MSNTVFISPFPGFYSSNAVKTKLLPLLPFAFIVIAFVFSGLVGHDPWKADEAYVFGVIEHMFQAGDWVVPTLAGEPFMEKPPLFYWVATAFGHVLNGWLPLHDSARLACAFFMLLTSWALAAATRLWWGAGMGRYAVLVLFGCFGTLVQSHMMMPDLALLSGFALSAMGFARVGMAGRQAGILIGIGAGIAFLSKGLIGPGVMGITAMLLLGFGNWRTRACRDALLLATLVALPFFLVWPAALYVRSPDLFMTWFWVNNIGRFIGFSVPQLGAEHLPWFWTQTIPWFTFPGLPIALWQLWRMRLPALANPAAQFSVVSFAVLMLVLAVSSSGRCVYAWPLLIPIAILAAPAAMALPAHADRAFTLFGLALFGALSAAVWAAWVIMANTGATPDWPRLLRVLPAEYMPELSAYQAVVALGVTILAALALRALWNKGARGLHTWVIGMTLAWSLLTTLWMPWLDFAKSYRSVFSAMPVPQSVDCIASYNLGEGERAMLRYVTGQNPVRREVSPKATCSMLLVQREVAYGEPDIDLRGWKEVWRGSRPGVTNERFWLFQQQ